MMRIIVSICFSVFTLLLLTTPVKSIDIINQTCKNITMEDPELVNYKFCVKAFRSVPSSRNATLARLGLISIKLVKRKVSSTRSYIKHFSRKKASKKMKTAIHDCLEEYSTALYNVGQGVEYYKSGDFHGANIVVTGVTDSASTCTDNFRDYGVACPFTKRINDTKQLAYIASSITDKFCHD